MYIFRNLLLTISLLTLLHSTDESNKTKSTGFFNFDKRLFISEEDGKFDVSAFLSTKYGYLPIPVVVTEPAIGYGGGLNIMFFFIIAFGTFSLGFSRNGTYLIYQ